MENRISPLLISVLCIGIAVLYIPILVLIGYSFNASSLVSVWGGFSTSWYAELLHNDQILDAAWLSLEIGVVVSTGAVILGTLAAISLVRFKMFRGRLLLTGMVNAPLVMPEIITGITQLLLFVSMLQFCRLAASRLHDHRDRAHRVLQRLRDRHRAIAPAERGPLARGGRHGSGLGPGARVHRHHLAHHRAGAGLELAAQLHAVAR